MPSPRELQRVIKLRLSPGAGLQGMRCSAEGADPLVHTATRLKRVDLLVYCCLLPRLLRQVVHEIKGSGMALWDIDTDLENAALLMSWQSCTASACNG